MSLTDEEIYQIVVDEVAEKKPPAVAVKSYIRKCLADKTKIVPVNPSADNIAHQELFQLIHDIMVFTSVCIAVYRPGIKKINKLKDDTRTESDLTPQQKAKIEDLIKRIIRDAGQ